MCTAWGTLTQVLVPGQGRQEPTGARPFLCGVGHYTCEDRIGFEVSSVPTGLSCWKRKKAEEKGRF